MVRFRGLGQRPGDVPTARGDARLVSLGGAASFWKILGEIRPGTIKADAERSFCILICGEPGAGKRTLRGALAGSRWPTDGTMPYVRIVEDTPTDTFGAGLALYVV